MSTASTYSLIANDGESFDTEKHITEWRKIAQLCGMVMQALLADMCEMSARYLQVLEVIPTLIIKKIEGLNRGVPFVPIFNEALVKGLMSMSHTATTALGDSQDLFSVAMLSITSSMLLMFEGKELPLEDVEQKIEEEPSNQ